MQAKAGANRREQRIKANSRASVTRTRAVQILTISNVPSGILDVIDELAAGEDRSRSSFIRLELRRIAAGYQAKAA